MWHQFQTLLHIFKISNKSFPGLQDANAKSMLSRFTAISTFQCSAPSPILHLSVPHIAYFKLTKAINFICFRLQIHTTLCVCQNKYYIYAYTNIEQEQRFAITLFIQSSALASPPQVNPWKTRVKRCNDSYENACQESCTSSSGVLESDTLSPQAHCIQAKQNQLPQVLLEHFVLHTLQQLCSPSLDPSPAQRLFCNEGRAQNWT